MPNFLSNPSQLVGGGGGQPKDPLNSRDAFDVTSFGLHGLSSTGQKATGFAEQLFDPQSPFYKEFQRYLQGIMGRPGTNTFLSPLMAQGSNRATGTAIANEQRQASAGRRTDAINTAVSGFASSNIGAGTNLMNIAGRSFGNIGQIGTNLRGADIQQGSQEAGWDDFLLAAAPLIAAPFTGGASLAAAPFTMPRFQPSDIRLKENIEYTGDTTTDGVPIVMFSYIGNKQRFRGVIAQDAEKIVPGAVIEINGIKHVDYGRL